MKATRAKEQIVHCVHVVLAYFFSVYFIICRMRKFVIHLPVISGGLVKFCQADLILLLWSVAFSETGLLLK